MGATNVCYTWEGADYKEGYDQLVGEARCEYGDSPYSGTIATMSLHRRPVRVAERFGKTAEKKARETIEKDGWGEKWSCSVLDLGVSGYELVSYKRNPGKATAKYETFYVVFADSRELSRHKTVADARKALVSAIERANGSVDWYRIEKVARRVGGDSLGDTYEKTTRILKSKPKRVPAGAQLRERHVFWYYGWAGC